jgi:hypothetical protein
MSREEYVFSVLLLNIYIMKQNPRLALDVHPSTLSASPPNFQERNDIRVGLVSMPFILL